jgi:hypothetical protein
LTNAKDGANLLKPNKQTGIKKMSKDKIAINKCTALKMFWSAGISALPVAQAEEALKRASDKLESMAQVTKGYWLADDVSKAVGKFK